MNKQRIFNFLNLNDPFFINSWSTNSLLERNTFKSDIRYILNFISGGDLSGMLNDILNRNERNSLQSDFKRALFYFGDIFTKANLKEKYKLLYPIRISGMTRKEASNLNFKSSTKLWAKCLKQQQRNTCGRKRLDKFYKEKIEEYMKSISSIAANRFLKKKQTNAYYCSTSLLKAYENFSLRSNLSFSSFYKYVDEKFKKPHRITDLCDYCEKNKEYKRELIKFANENFYETDDYLKAKEFLLSFKSGDELKNLLELCKKIDSIDFHLSIANRQRESYNSMRKNLESDYIILDIDWKQKIMIGMSPRQPSNEYRNQVSRTLFGVGVYYRENNEIKCKNFDLVSSFQSTESASDVIHNFRFLRKLTEFRQIEKKKYIIWADTGNHFRCSEVLDYFFTELFQEGIQVCLNFFAEKHGKNSRDQHFSAISNFIEQESLLKKLTCSQDIVDAIHKNQHSTNFRRALLKLDPIQTYAFVVEPMSLQPNRRTFRKVKNIRNYYNFFKNEADILRSVIISDLRISKIVEFESRVTETENSFSFNAVESKVKEEKLPNIVKKIKKLKTNLNSLNKNQSADFDSTQELSFLITNLTNDDDCNINICLEKCSSCTSSLAFRLSEINNEINSESIKEELIRHGHPSSRKNQFNKNRTKNEAIRELKNHYLIHHKRKSSQIESNSNFECLKCKKVFTTINSLTMHKLRAKH